MQILLLAWNPWRWKWRIPEEMRSGGLNLHFDAGVHRDVRSASILRTLLHEISHYFQWINGIDLPDRLQEWQANRAARRILRKYAETKEHP